MAGRKPLGPALVQHLEGSVHAKERLAMILATLAGRCSIAEACEQLGIGEAMFHRLRSEALQAGLDRLEPRPAGTSAARDSAEAQRIAELETRLAEVEHARQTAEVRLEVAQVLAAPEAEHVVKKTMAEKQRRRQQLRKRRKKKSS